MRSYTSAERRQRAGLVWKGARQAIADADTSSYDAQIAKLDARAEERGALEAAAANRLVEQARHEAAAAKAALRAARGKDRAAAQDAVRKAERRVRDTEQAARRYR
ncbi:hypothetical protein ABT010_13365 [Streptomyces sp. NPDC002668]|uniref:hypothetical protein n=1 Tax=Streptomyces sp. NPDC002668 TaxID=3154422 RepID=UPI0033184B75